MMILRTMSSPNNGKKSRMFVSDQFSGAYKVMRERMYNYRFYKNQIVIKCKLLNYCICRRETPVCLHNRYLKYTIVNVKRLSVRDRTSI